MSLSTEAPSTHQNPVVTARDTYIRYAVASLPYHRAVPDELAEDAFFATSLELTREWQEVLQTPNDKQQALPRMPRAVIEELPRERTVDIFHSNTLLAAWDLAASRSSEVSDDLRATVRINEAERALDLKDIIDENLAQQPQFLKRALGGACVTSLLNRQGFAMPLMAHQNLDYLSNPHAGILIQSTGKMRNQPYGVSYACGGFIEGHTGHARSFLGHYFRQIRVLSVCCDLSIDGNDGRRSLPLILSAMQNEIDGQILPRERAMLDTLGRRVAGVILGAPNRVGHKRPNC
jgi:hypothetical protein